MKFGWILVLASLFVACAKEETTDVRSQPSPYAEQQAQIEALQKTVSELSLLAADFTEGIANNFTDCATVTIPLEKKICQIAQTANAAQQLEIKSQLAIMGKEFQVALFGTDCTSMVEVGCPVAGSIQANIVAMQTAITTNTANIASMTITITGLQTSLSTLANRVTTLEGRLNNFNGSGLSIETLITNIQTDVNTLKTDVAAIQGTLADNKVLNLFAICGNNADSGPVYESLLLSGDRSQAFAYVRTGTKEGLGLFFSAGQPNTGFTTNLNTKTCRFKMYNNLTQTAVQACWVSTNRSATDAQIDAARTAGTATCTPF